MDTALALALVEAADRLIAGVDRLRDSLARLALRYRDTLTVGRTHGVAAEPTTFGLKVAVAGTRGRRNRERLVRARGRGWGRSPGPSAPSRTFRPRSSRRSAGRSASSRSRSRPRSCSATATPSSSRPARSSAAVERIATEIRSLQRTEILEAEEPFGEGQKGSSAMPHKRNPWLCEQVTGLARVLRAHAGAALEDIALWHERDISHSSVERIVLLDATILLDYLLGQTVRILDGLRVYPERMRENLERAVRPGVPQRVLLALTEAGPRARRPTGWSSGTQCGRGRNGGRSWSAWRPIPR